MFCSTVESAVMRNNYLIREAIKPGHRQSRFKLPGVPITHRKSWNKKVNLRKWSRTVRAKWLWEFVNNVGWEKEALVMSELSNTCSSLQRCQFVISGWYFKWFKIFYKVCIFGLTSPEFVSWVCGLNSCIKSLIQAGEIDEQQISTTLIRVIIRAAEFSQVSAARLCALWEGIYSIMLTDI